MIAYIIVEGSFDAQLLTRLLPKNLLDEVAIVSAGGLSAVKSLARSLLVRRQVPIAIVVDAGSTTLELIQERRQSIEEIVTSIAGNVPVKVIVAVPEIESVFFQNTSIIEKIFGCSIPENILAIADLQPCRALEQLFSQSKTVHKRADILNALTTADIEILCQASVVQELIQFLQSTHEIARASQKV